MSLNLTSEQVAEIVTAHAAASADAYQRGRQDAYDELAASYVSHRDTDRLISELRIKASLTVLL